MSYNQIIFWKWDDTDFQDEEYLRKIDDIAQRSVFDTILAALTWCKPSIHEPEAHRAVARAADRAHDRTIKFLLDIDVRPARSEFLRRFPNRTLAIVEPVIVELDEKGCAQSELSARESGDHYGKYLPIGPRVLRAYTYSMDGECYDASTLSDDTAACSLEARDECSGVVRINCGPEKSGLRACAFVAADYAYPDIFSQDLVDFHAELLEIYAQVPLDGATIDEWGAFPYPGFDFSGAFRRPWYSDSFAEYYSERTGSDLVLDFLNTLVAPSGDDAAQIAAINDYYDALRARNVEVEQFFYDSVKRIWGDDAFVGVHPTWFALEEAANTPELWKNGLDWWDVPRDYGQTDERAIHPVRLALAHKWGGAVFYNMWYTIGSLDLKTYWEEAWENLRYGGRTHTLGYECKGERGCVMELSGPGDLESVSQIEEIVRLANLFQRTSAKSNVAIVLGYPAAVNWKVNVEDGWHWDMRKGAFCDAFQAASDLFKAGYVCDLIPSYEIDDDDLRFADGGLSYGSETYDALVYVRPEYSTSASLAFLDSVVSSGFPTAILGGCGQDAPGVNAADRLTSIAGRARLALAEADPAPVIEALKEWGISANDVPNGARFQDGSVIVCNKGRMHRGEKLKVRGVEVSGHVVDADCEDAFGIALDENGEIDRLFAGALREVRIDGEAAVKLALPSDIYIERKGAGYRRAHLDGRDIIWQDAADLRSL